MLGGSTVTNTGPSTITGDLGVSPGTVGHGLSARHGERGQHATDAVARQAKSDLTTAYNDAAGRRLTASVAARLRRANPHCRRLQTSRRLLRLTGTLTLDAQGDPDAVFIFQIESTLTTATGSSVSLVNGAQACNVYWQVGSSATLGTRTAFRGTILALTSISVNDGVDRGRQASGPQRRGDADQRHDHAIAVCGRTRPGTGTGPARAPTAARART